MKALELKRKTSQRELPLICDLWIQWSYPSQHSGKPLLLKMKSWSRRSVSILDRRVLDLLSPGVPQESSLQPGNLCWPWSMPDTPLTSAELQGPGVSGQMDSKSRVTALSFCFLFSSKAPRCFIRWGTEGADQVSVGERKRRRKDEEIQEKIPICLEIHVHSQAWFSITGQPIAGSKNRNQKQPFLRLSDTPPPSLLSYLDGEFCDL